MVGAAVTACFGKLANSLHLPSTFAEANADSRTGPISFVCKRWRSLAGAFKHQTKDVNLTAGG